MEFDHTMAVEEQGPCTTILDHSLHSSIDLCLTMASCFEHWVLLSVCPKCTIETWWEHTWLCLLSQRSSPCTDVSMKPVELPNGSSASVKWINFRSMLEPNINWTAKTLVRIIKHLIWIGSFTSNKISAIHWLYIVEWGLLLQASFSPPLIRWQTSCNLLEDLVPRLSPSFQAHFGRYRLWLHGLGLKPTTADLRCSWWLE